MVGASCTYQCNLLTTADIVGSPSSNARGKSSPDLVKPFNNEPNRMHDSFPTILPNPLATLDQTELEKCITRHKRNLMLEIPLEGNGEQ